jgi:hypothetical protein
MTYKKLENCKYCTLTFENLNASERANHSRWCFKNPKRKEYLNSNDGSQFQTPEAIKKRTEGIKKAHQDGKYTKVYEARRGKPGTPHTEESKKLLSEKARASTHRRLLRSMRDYTCVDGTVVKLDSSWEETLAIRLDNLGIQWIRPDTPTKWVDKNGNERNYFPDFYLLDYDVYLDPKNPYAYKSQQEKIDVILKILPNLRILKTLKECQEFSI